MALQIYTKCLCGGYTGGKVCFIVTLVHTYQFPIDFRELSVQVLAADIRLALVDRSREGGCGLLPAKRARERAGEPAADGAATGPHERRRDGRAGAGGGRGGRGGRGGGDGSGSGRGSDSPNDALLLREDLLKERR